VPARRLRWRTATEAESLRGCYNAAMLSMIGTFDWLIVALVIAFLATRAIRVRPIPAAAITRPPVPSDQPAKSSPLQFSLARSLAAVALFCAAARMASLYSEAKYRFPADALYFFAAAVFGGAAIGVIFKKPTLWILLALLAASAAAICHRDFLVNPNVPLPD
jgi:hypothetical protein